MYAGSLLFDCGGGWNNLQVFMHFDWVHSAGERNQVREIQETTSSRSKSKWLILQARGLDKHAIRPLVVAKAEGHKKNTRKTTLKQHNNNNL